MFWNDNEKYLVEQKYYTEKNLLKGHLNCHDSIEINWTNTECVTFIWGRSVQNVGRILNYVKVSQWTLIFSFFFHKDECFEEIRTN